MMEKQRSNAMMRQRESAFMCVRARTCLSARARARLCRDQSKYQPCFPFFPTHAHTHTVINRHLVEHNPLAGFLKCDYQLGGDIKLLHLSVCFYLSIFPSPSNSLALSLSCTRAHTLSHEYRSPAFTTQHGFNWR